MLIVALLALHPLSLAERTTDALLSRVGFDRLEALSRELGIDEVGQTAASILSDGFEPGREWPDKLMKRLKALLREGLMEAMAALAAPTLATLCLKLVLGRRDGPLTLLCRLACACALAQRCAEVMDMAAKAMETSVYIADKAAPVLSAALTLTGSGTSGALLSPMTTLCGYAIQSILKDAGLALCGLAAIVAVAGNLSEHYRLDSLFALIRRATVWGVRLLIGGFVAWMALEGRLAAARDSATSQVLRQAIRGLIPFVGGSISDSAGALLESASTVRNTVGVTGLLIVLAACAHPLLRLTAHMLSLKLASAVIEPVADGGVVRITAGFGEVAKLLLALCAGSALLTALLAGSCLGLFGSV